MNVSNLTLPEFVFLDANCHQGNLLEGRTVVEHIRSHTVMEVFAEEDFLVLHLTAPTHEFTYTNHYGITEKHILALHYSLAHEFPMPVNDTLQEIFEKTAAWYREYLTWEDSNIKTDDDAYHN